MPVHDWSRVRAGVFHHFHQAWTIELYKALNRGLLPPGYFAMAEQMTGGLIPDVVCLEKLPAVATPPAQRGGIVVAETPPVARVQRRAAPGRYAAQANRLVIREPMGEVVAVVEVVSPGNKSSRFALESFVDKAIALMERGVHLLIVDLFPPGRVDPCGMHHAIWNAIGDDGGAEPGEKPLTVVAYAVGEEITAYVNKLAVGEELPEAPIFLESDRYVPAPLESTYQTTWTELPPPVRQLLA